MQIRRSLTVVCALIAICGPVGAEEIAPEKGQDIERLLNMTGELTIGRQVSSMVTAKFVEAMKTGRQDVPQSALDALSTEIAAVFDANIDSLKAEIVRIYDRHFTASEIRELIRFYSTDVGQKAIKEMPNLVQEGMVVGQRWAQSLTPRVQETVREKLRQQEIKD